MSQHERHAATPAPVRTFDPLQGAVEPVLGVAVHGHEAWLAVRRPGSVGRVVRLALPAGEVVGELVVDLPAAVKLDAERDWVASYLDDALVGFPR